MSSVLIVDDQPGFREILDRILAPAGYTTAQAGDADTALAMMAPTPPAVLFCDIEMPGHDGLWLVAQVRRQFPTVAIVIATSNDAVPASVSLQGGVVAYVLKPFQKEHVLGAVREASDWHRAAAARGQGKPPAHDPVDEWLRSRRSRNV
jgi:putative two-component system response regulator